MRKASSNGLGGFTLIELLVVISIISLLMSILLPALGRAREAGRQVQCLSNLRQIGVAMEMYVNAHGQSYPPKRLPGSTHSTAFCWVGKKGSLPLYDVETADQRYLNRYLGGYGPDAEVPVAHCPSDPALYSGVGSSYGANQFPSLKTLVLADNINPINRQVVREASKFVIGAEHGANHSAWGEAMGTSTGITEVFWHSNERKWNLVFGDGHAVFTGVDFSIIKTPAFNYEYE